MVTIRLLGVPAIRRDGQPLRPPRGRKAWVLLGYLLLAERPPSRRRVAEMLFGDANDPLRALRWTLAELRRSLGDAITFEGDPLICTKGVDVAVDVHTLVADQADPAELLGLEGELLEGLDLSSSPTLDSWLVVERHRLSAIREARLREAAVALLATGQARDAVAFAAAAVASNPLEEGNHELLVRSLAMSGNRDAALREVAVADDILQRELGIPASAALRDAARNGSNSSMIAPLGGRAAALSQLEAGRAAIAAGAVEAGLQCLRWAAAEADRCADTQLKGQALAALGGALIHATRGRDEEGSILLHEAIELAWQTGDRPTAVAAYRELGFVEVQAGRRDTAEAALSKAEVHAETDEELAAILGVRGMNESDRADYPRAFQLLRESVERADRCRDRRQQAWSLSLIARAHLLRGERSQATTAVTQSIELVYEERWMAFLPWPQTLSAELELAAGKSDVAAETLERAWHLACQLNDACWEGMAARGLSLLNTKRGEHDMADRWLAEAAVRSTRVPDRYQWVHAHVLDTMISSALDRGSNDFAGALIRTLAALAARCDMRELIVRAHLHRHRTGNRAALTSARLLAQDIDNPVLADLLRA